MSATQQSTGLNFHIKVLYLFAFCSLSGVLIELYFICKLSYLLESCSRAPIGNGGSDGESTLRKAATQATDSTRFKRQAPIPYNNDPKTVEFYPEPQPTLDTNEHVWLTSVSRIKVSDLTEFCVQAKEYCPKNKPGFPGIPGLPGAKGDKGDKGDLGVKGVAGPRGPTGVQGKVGLKADKGETGKPGSPGVDGRDGLPGVPGLDGMPGEPGFDGIPGMPGMPGSNGTNGPKGQKGEKGTPGATGPVGPPGPKGSKGDRGSMGLPGHPGIAAYKINNTEVHKLLIPAQMVDPELTSTMVVEEGVKVVMTCEAVGTPDPLYSWKKEGEDGIHYRNRTFLTSENGEKLVIETVTRDHIATYICTAGNGLFPPARKEINLDVHFPPLIKIQNHTVWAEEGKTVELKCSVEANPPGMKYWLRGLEKENIQSDDKRYYIYTVPDGFRITMVLEIKKVTESDYGHSSYQCICKNEKGIAIGTISLFRGNGSTRHILQEPLFHGKHPPIMPEEILCPTCVDCPPVTKCDHSGFLFSYVNTEIFNQTGLLKERTKECRPVQIGKPVFYREIAADWGTWMEDPVPNRPEHENTIWLTVDAYDKMQLLEFKNELDFKNNKTFRNYKLPYPFAGNGHIVYNGSLFYHAKGTNKIIKFDLSTNNSHNFTIKDLAYDDNNYLYQTKYNYVDIEADENGLWIIHASKQSNNTIIIKVDFSTLEVLSKWNITMNRDDPGEIFIICGILYKVDDVTQSDTYIRGFFDLYENKSGGTALNFFNPFRQNYLVGYDMRHEHIYSWDRGNLLAYPLKFS